MNQSVYFVRASIGMPQRFGLPFALREMSTKFGGTKDFKSRERVLENQAARKRDRTLLQNLREKWFPKNNKKEAPLTNDNDVKPNKKD